MYSVTLWRTSLNPGRAWNGATLSGDPVTKLSIQTTSQPCPRRNSQRWEPMNPAPPVTSARIAGVGGQDGLAADRVVLEAQAPHSLGLPQVAAVEDHRPAQDREEPLEVEELEFVPLGDEGDRVGVGRGGVRRVAIDDARRQHALGVLHGDGVVSADLGAELDETRDDLDRLRLAHVVRVRLEGEAQDGDALVVQRRERLLEHAHAVAGPLLVDLDRGPEQDEIHAARGGRVDERVGVLREAAPAVAEAGLQERG